MTNRILNISDIVAPCVIYKNRLVCKTMHHHDFGKIAGKCLNINFYGLILLTEGDAYMWNDDKEECIHPNYLLVLPPFKAICLCKFSADCVASALFVESDYFENIMYYDSNLSRTFANGALDKSIIIALPVQKSDELQSYYRQIETAISQPHLYKDEMLQYLVHISQMYIAELLQPISIVTTDFRHKENVYKIFVHLARENFRKERQMRFYADKLSISTAYLSRTVKEVSGNTVLDILSTLLYNEICKLLVNEDKTISEIAYELNFSDQSALTNFFKQKAGCSPMVYRKAYSR